MKSKYRSLKTNLFMWYVGSLFLLVSYFFIFIHYYTIPYGMHILALLFVGLAVTGFLIIFRITQSLTYLSSRINQISQKNLEEKITGIKDTNEIGQLADNFNHLLSRLNGAFKRERQFITDVAHEMKTPLTTIKSSMEVALQKERQPSEYKQILKDSIREVDSLSVTLQNVLHLAWTETPYAKNNSDEINLSELMDELVDIGNKLSKSKGISIRRELEPNIKIKGFRDKLARAILNLIENAVKYSRKHGEIRVGLKKIGHQTVIKVEDHGMGINQEDLPHIFERFYRGSKSSREFGAGLGLAIVKSTIELHKGQVEAASVPGRGSVFTVTLPIN